MCIRCILKYFNCTVPFVITELPLVLETHYVFCDTSYRIQPLLIRKLASDHGQRVCLHNGMWIYRKAAGRGCDFRVDRSDLLSSGHLWSQTPSKAHQSSSFSSASNPVGSTARISPSDRRMHTFWVTNSDGSDLAG